MAETDKQIDNKAEKSWLYKKGESGNPLGRPKKEKTFSDTARLLLAANELDIDLIITKDGKVKKRNIHLETTKSFYHGLVSALISEGMKGNVHAIKELIDRADGKVKERIELDTRALIIQHLPPVDTDN